MWHTHQSLLCGWGKVVCCRFPWACSCVQLTWIWCLHYADANTQVCKHALIFMPQTLQKWSQVWKSCYIWKWKTGRSEKSLRINTPRVTFNLTASYSLFLIHLCSVLFGRQICCFFIFFPPSVYFRALPWPKFLQNVDDELQHMLVEWISKRKFFLPAACRLIQFSKLFSFTRSDLWRAPSVFQSRGSRPSSHELTRRHISTCRTYFVSPLTLLLALLNPQVYFSFYFTLLSDISEIPFPDLFLH